MPGRLLWAEKSRQPPRREEDAMDTGERIVEAYVRYVKGWATTPDIRCEGQL